MAEEARRLSRGGGGDGLGGDEGDGGGGAAGSEAAPGGRLLRRDLPRRLRHAHHLPAPAPLYVLCIRDSFDYGAGMCLLYFNF